MFQHSVKVPRPYKIAATIYKKVAVEGGSVKTLLYDDKLRHFRTNVLYALITETIKHATDIDKIFESCNLLANEPRLDPWLARVLTAELLFGKKSLPGQSKPEQTILSYKDQFDNYINGHQDDLKIEAIRRPRYVRINTNLLTTSDAIRAFQDDGYHFIRCTSGSYNDYLEQLQGLTEYDFTQDYHVKTMFVFSPGTKLHEHELYLENKIILQDKATAMAVHLLAPPPGSVILDLCAAPGMKTTQLAAYIRNEGKIYAVERNEKRYQTLCEFVERTGSKCVVTLHKDSLDIKRGDLDDVEYILLDPSCSGSGMEYSVHNYIDKTRLAKLTSLQEKFLKHAMNSFPKAKRIVYSTCSVFPEENERVVTNNIKTSRAKWRVQEVKELLKGQWNNFGSGMYGSIGARCMYAKPDSDFTTGFFVAVLDRDFDKSKIDGEKDERHMASRKGKDNITNDSSQSDKVEINESQDVDDVQSESDIDKSHTKKKKKKQKSNKIEENEDVIKAALEDISNKDVTLENGVDDGEVNGERIKKKKKHKNKESVEDSNCSIAYTQDVVGDTIEMSKKEKKKIKIEGEIQTSDEILSTKNESVKKKKKKERIKVEDNGETQMPPEISSSENYYIKKRKKNRSPADIERENVNLVIDGAPKKKKKKNRDKETSN